MTKPEYETQEVYSLDGKLYYLVEFPLGTFLYDPDAKGQEITWPHATKAIPGTAEKIAVLAERVAKGHADNGTLFHPEDLHFGGERIRNGHELLDFDREEWSANAPEEPTTLSLEEAGIE